MKTINDNRDVDAAPRTNLYVCSYEPCDTSLPSINMILLLLSTYFVDGPSKAPFCPLRHSGGGKKTGVSYAQSRSQASKRGCPPAALIHPPRFSRGAERESSFRRGLCSRQNGRRDSDGGRRIRLCIRNNPIADIVYNAGTPRLFSHNC